MVPAGCLGLIVLVGSCVVGVFTLVSGSIKSSGPYAQGLEMARQSPAVVAALGEPIETGWMVSGSINVSGSSGEADLAIPLEGPDGEGKLYVVADKEAGEWTFRRAEVEVPGGDRIDLLGTDF